MLLVCFVVKISYFSQVNVLKLEQNSGYTFSISRYENVLS